MSYQDHHLRTDYTRVKFVSVLRVFDNTAEDG